MAKDKDSSTADLADPDEMIDRSPALVLRWLLGLELAGKVEALTAVLVTTDGRLRYIRLHNGAPPPRGLEATNEELKATLR